MLRTGAHLARAVGVLLGVSVLTWILLELAPGSAADLQARQFGESEPTLEQAARIRRELGLDRSSAERYVRWLWRLVHGDLGRSFRDRTPVLNEVLDAFRATAVLACTAFGLVITVGCVLGVVAASKPGSARDVGIRLFALAGAAIPSYFLGLALVYIFAVWIGVLPSFGRGGVAHLVLPASTLALGSIGSVVRVTRAAMLEQLHAPFITVARSRGLSEHRLRYRHALRNAAIVPVQQLGLVIAGLLGGTVIVETIFAWPGLGRYAVTAVTQQDFPALQGAVLAKAVLYVFLSMVLPTAERWIDPRLRRS